MSQHQDTSTSKNTKFTQKVSAPPMDIPDDEILDVVPLSVIPCEAIDLNQPIDASASACTSQGNISSIPSGLTPATNSKEDIHHTDRVIRNLVTRIDGSSDDQEESLLHRLKPSVAKRMKTRKGRSVAELMSARKAKKTVGIGPSKSWSKVEVKKRKDGAAKWKFVIQRRVVVERELGKDVVDVKEVMDLIKEFIVNIPEDIADKNNKEFCKVFVRGRKIEGAGELEVTNNEVCREITARQVKGGPIKKHLPTGKLTVKYDILHKIGAANWHASTNAVKLPIAFPYMICGIILNQHPGILCSNDLPSRRKPALSVHYKLFKGIRVEDIVMTSSMKKPASKVGTIVELKETCKELGEGIRVATARKKSLEALIASLEQDEGENIENDNVNHEEEAEAHTSSERSGNNDDTSGNYVSGANEALAYNWLCTWFCNPLTFDNSVND
ncbi:uncharacterized protein LOC127131670 [Lathyrus oleraceus]|uniref:uncharacterized protein LOC127131670 n=1 Tax=Pisum sativum TaxID=3888 RepID=UPI0021D20BAB|nr:uncharacterized protein LOC127131670 [Pisum sativum]